MAYNQCCNHTFSSVGKGGMGVRRNLKASERGGGVRMYKHAYTCTPIRMHIHVYVYTLSLCMVVMKCDPKVVFY